jgi:hypothetical protein
VLAFTGEFLHTWLGLFVHEFRRACMQVLLCSLGHVCLCQRVHAYMFAWYQESLRAGVVACKCACSRVREQAFVHAYLPTVVHEFRRVSKQILLQYIRACVQACLRSGVFPCTCECVHTWLCASVHACRLHYERACLHVGVFACFLARVHA